MTLFVWSTVAFTLVALLFSCAVGLLLTPYDGRARRLDVTAGVLMTAGSFLFVLAIVLGIAP